MAINSAVCVDVKSTYSAGSSNNSKSLYGNVSSCALKGSISPAYCSANKYRKKKNSDSKSPYLNGDNVPNMTTTLIEKNFVSKKGSNIVSSFPLAVNIYKANSDEFRHLKSANRKPKKSVLTLPNLPAPLPQTCTVSDMNDSEYFNQDDERKKIKKRNPTPRNRKTKYEYYDMNARFHSQMNTDLDCSSSDMLQNYTDGKRSRKQKLTRVPKHGDQKSNSHDAWAILRNINRFQFRPSPPMSDVSSIPKKLKGRKKRQKDVRVVETEEFAYITSSYDIESKSQRSNSKSSSFDRITVIDKEHEFTQLCKEFERRFSRANNLPKGSNKHQIRNQNNKAIAYNNRNSPKHYSKNVIQKFNANQTINTKPSGYEYNQKKIWNNNCGDINTNKMQYNVLSSNNLCNDDYLDYNVNKFSSGFEEEIEQDFIYSGNSISSQAAVGFKGGKYAGKRGPESSICSSSDHCNPLEGKTKFDFNKAQKRNRQMIPKSVSKLTKNDIQRRIARLKFPIVVLGKDQLSSNFEVVTAEPLHFKGLKTHIWPFMRQWQNQNTKPDILKDNISFKVKTDSSLQKKISIPITDSGLQKKKFTQPFVDSNKLELNKPQKLNRRMVTPKTVIIEQAVNNDSKIKHSSGEQKSVKMARRVSVPQKRPTSVYMFKQKVMKLLYNNLSNQNLANETKAISKLNDVNNKLTSKATCNEDATPVKRVCVKSKEVPHNINSPVKTSKQGVNTKKRFIKPSWASEFIDNVIKKIKNGVYYNQDSSKINRKRHIEVKEVEIQTIATGIDKTNSIMQSISKVTITKKSLGRINLPGFDDSKLPALEIQTLNSNEILVKHCVTNILVHFDITAPNESIFNVNKSMSLMPLDGGGSHIKAYKCKTSIINSMLPAEICTLLPKMMSNLSTNLSLESHSGLINPRNSLDKSPTLLSTISEIHTESPDTLRPLPFLLHLKMAVELQWLLDGFYPRKLIRQREFHSPKLSFSKPLDVEMLPILSTNHVFNCDEKSTTLILEPFCKIMLVEIAKNPFWQNPVNTCVTMQTYSTSNRLKSFSRFDVNSFLKSITSYPQSALILPRVFNYLFDKNITINLTTINSQGLEDLITLNIRSMMTGNNDRNCTKITENLGSIKKDLPPIEYIELTTPVLNKNSSTQFSNGSYKSKKKGYQKLYRKCQSTSNIPVKKSTSLSKITNIDEFFQALGSDTQFSAVFDKTYSTKIMSSLKEMSNWIMDINPTQALLVLLLTNKKDTPDLVRFRPVILQGIAFKRITRAKELDMEIEVIEREQMNGGRQASDYQRIFDDSSRRLLRSLLEKRKKLNPSYLRVMARYVGLGLLKTPQKQ